jgi:hypothetical protein
MDILPRKQDYANPFVPLIVNKDRYLDPILIAAAPTTSDELLNAEQETPVSNPNTTSTDQFYA